jgi:hypothetical protein
MVLIAVVSTYQVKHRSVHLWLLAAIGRRYKELATVTVVQIEISSSGRGDDVSDQTLVDYLAEAKLAVCGFNLTGRRN